MAGAAQVDADEGQLAAGEVFGLFAVPLLSQTQIDHARVSLQRIAFQLDRLSVGLGDDLDLVGVGVDELLLRIRRSLRQDVLGVAIVDGLLRSLVLLNLLVDAVVEGLREKRSP